MPTNDQITLRVKKDIIKTLKKTHFKYHSYINLTDYVSGWPDKEHNHNGVAMDVAKKMQESGEFTYEEKGTLPEYWVEKAVRKSFSERNPVLSQIRTGTITFLFSIAASMLIYYLQNQEKDQLHIQQNTHLNNLSDSVNMLQSEIDKILKVHDKDTSKHQ